MSRKPYLCFKCRDSGYPNTMVYLAGKDDQGRTIQLKEDGTKHIHKTKQTAAESPPQQQQLSDESVSVQKLLVTMDKKLDRLLNLAELKKQ